MRCRRRNYERTRHGRTRGVTSTGRDATTAEPALLVGRVPLLGLPEVPADVALDATHRVHRVVHGLAVRTVPAPAVLPLRRPVDHEERPVLAALALVLRDVQRLAVVALDRQHTPAYRSPAFIPFSPGCRFRNPLARRHLHSGIVAPALYHYSDLENVYDTPERAGRLASLLADRGDAIAVGSGDNTSPGVLSLVTDGWQAMDLYDAVDPDVATFGNHDFDYGPETTAELVAASPQTWVSANVTLDGNRIDGAEPWTVVERDDTRVGFFGVLDDSTPALNPMASDLTVTDPIAAANDAEGELRDAGVDYVVALSHLGRGDEELAAATTVDAVLGGHIASERVERLDDTLLTRPGSGGEVVLEVDLESGDVTRHVVDESPVHEGVASSLRQRMADAGLDEVVGRVEEPMERTERTLFRGESRIGNFVADAYRWAAGADVGLQNSGGVRDGPALDGDVTVADLVSVVPFEEPVSVAELTGAELLDVFRAAKGGELGFAQPDWWHAHVSGAELEWHDGDGLASARVDGELVDPDATYTVATTDYLFYSDDEFPALDEHHRVDRLDVQHEVLAAYARQQGIDPRVEGRIRLHADD